MAMRDMDMDVGKAQIWIKEVKEEIAEVERTLKRVNEACMNVPGEDDTVFQFIERTGKVMNDVWTTASDAYKSAWGLVEEGIDELKKAGKSISESFEVLRVR